MIGLCRRVGTPLGPHRPSRPVVRLGLQAAAPGVERVVHDHAVFEHLVIIREVGREAERDREQAGALRTQIVARGIRARTMVARWSSAGSLIP